MNRPTTWIWTRAIGWKATFGITLQSVLLVSHDRHFLDVVVKRCTELFRGKLEDYHGNFSYFEVEKERRYDALVEAARRQQEEIDKLERFIERFRYKASKASQVQSRVKQLEKIERIVLPPSSKKVAFSFPTPPAFWAGCSRSSKHFQILQRKGLCVAGCFHGGRTGKTRGLGGGERCRKVYVDACPGR